MRRWPLALLAIPALLGVGWCALQPSDAVAAPPDYAQQPAWLCRPGRDDACAVDLETTSVAADGTLSVQPSPAPATDPVADCFYVYPTVSLDESVNSDLEAGPEEARVAAGQFARFRTACRTFAPVYRQMTLTALRAAALTGGERQGADLAYGDVRAAFRDYLARDNGGRPFVLIGHSQGAGMLKQLVAEEIEGRPVARRMLSAMLIGSNVKVATGRDMGGDFVETPLCRTEGQIGCVVAYVSFRAESPPPKNSRFGRTDVPGRSVGCTNPAALAGGAALLGSVLPTAGVGSSGSEQPDWVAGRPQPGTRFVRAPGLLSGECVDADGATVLAVKTRGDPADPRTDLIGGDVRMLGRTLSDWGLHLLDINLAQDDLIAIVERQLASWQARAR